jgi:D-arabinose 1-dehydrogenase-like Zn-dependent alcohol dehydrogenase
MFWQVYHVHSGLVASRADHDEMLDFCAKNGVKPLVQVHKFQGPDTVSDIFKRLFANSVRYRAVIEF